MAHTTVPAEKGDKRFPNLGNQTAVLRTFKGNVSFEQLERMVAKMDAAGFLGFLRARTNGPGKKSKMSLSPKSFRPKPRRSL